jgi:hypothetical protein
MKIVFKDYSDWAPSEIRRIEVQSQSGEIVLETLISKIPNKKQGWWSDSSGRAPA